MNSPLGYMQNRPARSIAADHRKATLLAEVQRGRKLYEACEVTRIPKRTVQNWRENDPSFKDALTQARTAPRRLTQRDRDVLRLIASGYPDKAIAVEIHLSERATRQCILDLMRKRNVQCRAQLAIEAVKVGAIVVEVTA